MAFFDDRRILAASARIDLEAAVVARLVDDRARRGLRHADLADPAPVAVVDVIFAVGVFLPGRRSLIGASIDDREPTDVPASVPYHPVGRLPRIQAAETDLVADRVEEFIDGRARLDHRLRRQ